MNRRSRGVRPFFRRFSGLLHEPPATLPVVKILDPSRRDALAIRFALLAAASLLTIGVAAAVTMRGEVRSVLATAGLLAYAFFAGRAMQLWQGRGHPSLHRSAWRRRFLHERTDTGEGTPVVPGDRHEDRRSIARR
jgi:hypothetical protein